MASSNGTREGCVKIGGDTKHDIMSGDRMVVVIGNSGQ